MRLPFAFLQVDAGLILDSQGNLYGTTSGSNGNSCGGTNSCGNTFKIGSSGTYAVLYRFAGGKDGAVPEAGLVMDGQGNLYGTTFLGGGSGCQSEGCGTVFELTAAGTELVLYRFAGGSDGLGPAANLIFDGRGNRRFPPEFSDKMRCTIPPKLRAAATKASPPM